jgi:L-amino acid N-acyltransferase YncA
MLIRPATEDDLPAIFDVYAHEAATGFATFDSEPRPLESWRAHLASTERGDHLLVAEEDGVLLGYASSGPYRPRPAYRQTREASVYLTAAARGRGCGRKLYDALLAALRCDGMHLVVAVTPCRTTPAWPCTGGSGSPRSACCTRWVASSAAGSTPSSSSCGSAEPARTGRTQVSSSLSSRRPTIISPTRPIATR